MSDRTPQNRYPFTMPSGWFAVAQTPDVEVGDAKAVPVPVAQMRAALAAAGEPAPGRYVKDKSA